MKLHSDSINISALDSEIFHDHRDQKERNERPRHTAGSYPHRSYQKQLLFEHHLDLPFCHTDCLKQSIMSYSACHRKIHDVIDQQIRTQTGNKDQSDQSSKDLNRFSQI